MAGIITEIGADSKQFDRVIATLPDKVEKASRKMASKGAGGGGMMDKMMGGMMGRMVGIGTAYTAIAGIRNLMSEMDDLADTAMRLGESTESIQRVAYASNILAGVDASGISGAFLKLEAALGDSGNKGASQALEHLGISAAKLAGMTLDEKVLAMGEAFVKARATGTGYNDILTLLGKSAGELIPLLTQFEEAKKLMADASIVSESDVARMGAVNDLIDGLILKSKAGAATVASEWMNVMSRIDWKAFFTFDAKNVFDFEGYYAEIEEFNEKIKNLKIEREKRAKLAEEDAIKKALEDECNAYEEKEKKKSEIAERYSKERQKVLMDAAEASDDLRQKAVDAAQKNHADIASRLNDLASKGESRMQDFIGAAFSPLKGDADISTGRGSNVNPLTRGASEQVKKMAEQVNLLKKQAATLDKSVTHLASIDAQIKKMGIPISAYN